MRLDDRIPLYVSIPVEEANKILRICHDKDISISDYVTNALKEHGRKERFFHRQIIDKNELAAAIFPEALAKVIQERIMHELTKGLCEAGAITFYSEEDKMQNRIMYTGQIDVIMPEKEIEMKPIGGTTLEESVKALQDVFVGHDLAEKEEPTNDTISKQAAIDLAKEILSPPRMKENG